MTNAYSYIKKEDAISLFEKICDYEKCTNVRGGMWCDICTKGMAMRELRNKPAENVAPVRRGDWEDVEVVYGENVDVASMRCSKCKRWTNRVFFYGNPTDFVNFCQYCGARMKEKLDGMDDIDIDADDDDEEKDE